MWLLVSMLALVGILVFSCSTALYNYRWEKEFGETLKALEPGQPRITFVGSGPQNHACYERTRARRPFCRPFDWSIEDLYLGDPDLR